MIAIATHKDFNYKNNFKNAIIIDGNECKKTYSIPVIHENDMPSHYTELHDTYAELSRLHHFYCNYKHKDRYMGFMQYKRILDVKEEDIPSIIEKHGIILPNTVIQSPSISKAYHLWHKEEDIQLGIDIIKRVFPHYSDDVDKYIINNNKLYPHNVFIMDDKHFCDYCFFMFRIFEEFDKIRKYKTYKDWKNTGQQQKAMGFLAERLSNVFYYRFFENPYTARFV